VMGKINKTVKVVQARGVAQVVESLPRKHKALSSNSSTIKKKKDDYCIRHGGSHL
jgi:hypothetical protein